MNKYKQVLNEYNKSINEEIKGTNNFDVKDIYKSICYYRLFVLHKNKVVNNKKYKILTKLLDAYFEIERNISSFVNSTGLIMRTCNPEGIMKSNEWKVALYLCKQPDLRDFHFFLQEKDGTWSSKYGYNADQLDSLKELPKEYIAPIFHDKYDYYKTFAIENPFVREK